MLGFIIAAAAGFFTPMIRGPIVDPLVKALDGHIAIEPTEKPLLGLMLCMLAAAIAAALLESGTPFWIILGGVLGYFGSRIVAAGKKIMDARDTSE